MDVLSSTAIIHCKKYHKMHRGALMSKSYQTQCVCKHFNIKTSKPQMLFAQNYYKFPARAVLLKSWENHRNLKISAKSCDFMPPRGALAMLCHAPRARILCKKYHAGDMRARRLERMLKSFQSRRRHWRRRWPCRACAASGAPTRGGRRRRPAWSGSRAG